MFFQRRARKEAGWLLDVGTLPHGRVSDRRVWDSGHPSGIPLPVDLWVYARAEWEQLATRSPHLWRRFGREMVDSYGEARMVNPMRHTWRAWFVACLSLGVVVGATRAEEAGPPSPAEHEGVKESPSPRDGASGEAKKTSEGESSAKPDWTRINGVVLHERHFVVRTGGEHIGAAKLEVREFQNGALLRTGLEYWLFNEAANAQHAHFWFQGFGSEFADRRPLAMWGAANKGDLGMHFRVQGDGGWLTVKGNDYGKTRMESKVRPPEGFRLINDLRLKMYDPIKGKGSTSFTWKRCHWRKDPITWHEYTYTYAGKESIKTAEGKVVEVHRFDITCNDRTTPSETLWVDDEVYPVRRMVGGKNGLELLLSDGKPHEQMGRFPTWSQAVEKFGESRLEHIMLAAGIDF